MNNITAGVDVEEILLDLDYAVPCGLILNELISNAFKYAFPDGRRGRLEVSLKRLPDQSICLQIADNGIGFPSGVDFRNSPSLGLQLVNNLVEQIDGAIELEPQAGGETGARFTIRFAA